MKNIYQLAKIYILSSIFIGPLILILGYRFTSGGGDYSDSSYLLADGTYSATRDQEFQRAELFQTVCASIMILIGVTLAILILTNKYGARINKQTKMKTLVGISVMIIGYIFVITLSGKGVQS